MLVVERVVRCIHAIRIYHRLIHSSLPARPVTALNPLRTLTSHHTTLETIHLALIAISENFRPVCHPHRHRSLPQTVWAEVLIRCFIPSYQTLRLPVLEQLRWRQLRTLE